MSDPRDRVLEHALGRLLRPEADDADQAAALLRAWERGERGTGLPPEWSQDDPAEFARPSAAPARPDLERATVARRPFAWRRAAAAAVLVAGVGLSWLALRDGGASETIAPAAPRPLLARASEPVAGAHEGTRISPGDVTWVDAGRAVRFALEGGGELLARGPAALGWRAVDDGVGVDLLDGAVEVERAGPGLELHTDFGRIAAHGAASFVAALAPDDAVRGWAPLPLEPGVVANRTEPSRLLRVDVLKGSAELSSARSIERVPAGTRRWLASDPGTTESLSRRDEERLTELFAAIATRELPYATGGAAMEKLFEWREGAWLELSSLLAARPERWAVLEPRIRAEFEQGFAGSGPGGPQGWTLDLLVRDRSRTSLRIARDLWRSTPQAFTLDHVLALADRGAFEFERELYAIALSGAEPEPMRREIAACQIALDGDPVVRDLLRARFDALEPADGEASPDMLVMRRLTIAAALDAIGDPLPLRSERARIVQACRGWLDSGQTARAQRTALIVEFLDRLRAGPDPSLAYAAFLAEQFLREGQWTYADEEELRALLDELEARGQ